jgi:hypothetical protein
MSTVPAPADPLDLEQRRKALHDRLRDLRGELDALAAAYRALPNSGVLLDTPGVGALTTSGYCVAGALEIFEETAIELDAADDALDRAAQYTTRLRPVVLEL